MPVLSISGSFFFLSFFKGKSGANAAGSYYEQYLYRGTLNIKKKSIPVDKLHSGIRFVLQAM
jgi:hypothetical protein